MANPQKKEVSKDNSITLKVVARGHDSQGVPVFDVNRVIVCNGKETEEALSINGDTVRTISVILIASNYMAVKGLSDIVPAKV